MQHSKNHIKITDIEEIQDHIDLFSITSKDEMLEVLNRSPVLFGLQVGYTDLTKLHNYFLKLMIQAGKNGKEMKTIIAHRGSYKSTCAVIYTCLAVLFDSKKTIAYTQADEMLMNRRMDEINSVIQTKLYRYIASVIYGIKEPQFIKRKFYIASNLPRRLGQTSNVISFIIGGKIQGLHCEIVITDDIVVEKDRAEYSKRTRTKTACRELFGPVLGKKGIKMINICTPWHPNDAVEEVFKRKEKNRSYIEVNCEESGMLTKEDIIQERVNINDDELFNANYYLIHTTADQMPFTEVKRANISIADFFGGQMHIDPSFYGKDKTAITIVCKTTNKQGIPIYKVHGVLIDSVAIPGFDELFNRLYTQYGCIKLWVEKNGAQQAWIEKEVEDIKRLYGTDIEYELYYEGRDKRQKIALLRKFWDTVFFDTETDEDYIKQIETYTLNYRIEHDDAPDSLVSLLLKMETPVAELIFHEGRIL